MYVCISPNLSICLYARDGFIPGRHFKSREYMILEHHHVEISIWILWSNYLFFKDAKDGKWIFPELVHHAESEFKSFCLLSPQLDDNDFNCFHFMVTLFWWSCKNCQQKQKSSVNWCMFYLQPNLSSIFPLQHQFPASFTVKLHKKWFNFVLWTFSLSEYFIELSTFL